MIKFAKVPVELYFNSGKFLDVKGSIVYKEIIEKGCRLFVVEPYDNEHKLNSKMMSRIDCKELGISKKELLEASDELENKFKIILPFDIDTRKDIRSFMPSKRIIFNSNEGDYYLYLYKPNNNWNSLYKTAEENISPIITTESLDNYRAYFEYNYINNKFYLEVEKLLG